MNDTILILSSTLPVIAAILVIVLSLLHISFSLRKRIPAKVNCWFCNSWLKVPYENRNCFDCYVCLQYNGFDKNGDYNKIIPEKYEIKNDAFTSKKLYKKNKNGLCKICNNNQQLKINQLANFVPMNQHNYDKEIEHYEKLLEEAYKLCPKCENVLKSKLDAVNRWLFGMKFTYLKSENKLKLPKSIKKSTVCIKMLLMIFAFFTLINILSDIDYSKKNLRENIPNFLFPYALLLKSKLLVLCNYIQSYYYTTTLNVKTNYLVKNYEDFFDNLKNISKEYTNNTNSVTFYVEPILELYSKMLIFSFIKIFFLLMTLLSLYLHLTLYIITQYKQIVPVIAWITILITKLFDYVDTYVRTIQGIGIFLIICYVIHSKKMKKSNSQKRSLHDVSKSNYSKNEIFSSLNKNDASSKSSTFFSDLYNLSSSTGSSINSYASAFTNYKAVKRSPTKSDYVFGSSSLNRSRSPTSFSEISSISKQTRQNPYKTNTKPLDLQSASTASLFNNSSFNCSSFDKDLNNSFFNLNIGNNIQKCYVTTPTTKFIVNKDVDRPRPVVSPAKLNIKYNTLGNIDQYITLPDTTLSRSSSQSSGFVSQTTTMPENNYNSLPSSCANSLHGDIDSVSLLSEPINQFIDKESQQLKMHNYFYPINKPKESQWPSMNLFKHDVGGVYYKWNHSCYNNSSYH